MPGAVTEVGGSMMELLFSVFKMINKQLLSNNYSGAEATVTMVVNHTEARQARQKILETYKKF